MYYKQLISHQCCMQICEMILILQAVNQLTINKKIHGLFVNNIPISIIILILCRKILPLFSLPEAVFGDFLPLKIRIQTFYFSASNVSSRFFFNSSENFKIEEQRLPGAVIFTNTPHLRLDRLILDSASCAYDNHVDKMKLVA